MYEELIKELRYCGSAKPCETCGRNSVICQRDLHLFAADALEDMNRRLEDMNLLMDAAVNDINGLGRGDKENCAYCFFDWNCEPEQARCELGEARCISNSKNFLWRGCTRAGTKAGADAGIIPDGVEK